MNVEATDKLADEFTDYLFASMRAYYDKTGVEEVPAGVILSALIEATGATLCVVPENRRPGAVLAFIQDVIDETARAGDQQRQDEFLEELRDRLSRKPAEAA